MKHNEGEGGVEARTQRTKRISTLAPRIAFPGFSAGLSVRLAARLRGAVSEESRVKGDLARIVLFALSHVDKEEVDIQQTRKAGMDLTNPQLIHIGAEARTKLKEWAEAEGMSVNAIVVSVLDEFFKRLKKSKALREELRLEIRAHRGFLPG